LWHVLQLSPQQTGKTAVSGGTDGLHHQMSAGTPTKPVPPRPHPSGFVDVGAGSIEVIFGPMFSGKTTELLRRIKRHTIAGRRCLVVKYVKDTRYSRDKCCTHDMQRSDAISAALLAEIEDVDDYDVIGIDEGQFVRQTKTTTTATPAFTLNTHSHPYCMIVHRPGGVLRGSCQQGESGDCCSIGRDVPTETVWARARARAAC